MAELWWVGRERGAERVRRTVRTLRRRTSVFLPSGSCSAGHRTFPRTRYSSSRVPPRSVGRAEAQWCPR